jgi:segregation and condensation protein B
VRGVSVRSNIIRTLQEREWIRVVGYRDIPGKPALFGTTRAFLDYFNLSSLDDLPSLAEIKDMDNFDPELDFGPVAEARASAGEAFDDDAGMDEGMDAGIDAEPGAAPDAEPARPVRH